VPPAVLPREGDKLWRTETQTIRYVSLPLFLSIGVDFMCYRDTRKGREWNTHNHVYIFVVPYNKHCNCFLSHIIHSTVFSVDMQYNLSFFMLCVGFIDDNVPILRIIEAVEASVHVTSFQIKQRSAQKNEMNPFEKRNCNVKRKWREIPAGRICAM
jgi:hypothetical protein